MADRRLEPDAFTGRSTHTSKPSLETNASGFAESAISFSAFPEPPTSIPSTPVRSVFGEPSSPSSSNPHFPGPSRQTSYQATTNYIPPLPSHLPRFAGLESTRHHVLTNDKRENGSSSVSPSALSPYDWHEGASSIHVDAAEDRLLSTSFITSLLRENTGPLNRSSYSSDAMSGISEMTYPPKYPNTNSLRDLSLQLPPTQSRRESRRGPSSRPVGARAPSSYLFRQGSQSRAVGGAQHSPHATTTPANGPSTSRLEQDQAITRSGSELSHTTLIEQSERDEKYGEKLAVYSEVDESDDSGYPGDTNSNSTSGFATSQTNLAQRHQTRKNVTDSRPRESVISAKSATPSFLSRISSVRSIRRALTWRRKPLPAVPIISNVPIAAEREHRKREEETPLPELVHRADRLHTLLEKGFHPHNSLASPYAAKTELFTPNFDDAETMTRYKHGRLSHQPPPSRILKWLQERKMWVIIGIFVLVAVVAIGTAVGVTAKANKVRKSSCPANTGGAKCNLNATCVCTTTSDPCENPLARAILDLAPEMNERLSTNISTSDIYNSLWIIQGSIQDTSCAQQTNLIDPSPLDAQSLPNRTQWAQIALLWTVTQTQDQSPVAQLQDFIRKAPWSQLSNTDGPVASTPSFTTTAAGFVYDFAAQTILPQPSTFIDQGQPLNEQIAKVDTGIRPKLDRMYSYAVASSMQRDKALLNFWTSVLHQDQETLNPFKAAFSASPIILPLDGTSQSIINLYNASSSFPPPVACYPGLQSDQKNLIGTVEENAFGLSAPANVSQFDSACFPQHPTYGVLDILRLRLPFLDSRTNVASQGIILQSDVAPRTVLAVGEALSALPGSNNLTRSPSLLTDPRSYGTTAFASHIILQYLASVPPNTANTIIQHVLNSTGPIPPPNPSLEPPLFPLQSIPMVEVAVFGSIDGSDAGSYISSFTTASNSLFFGSNDGTAFRTWAIGNAGTIAWTVNATSPEVVHDNSFSDSVFNLTWSDISTAISTHAENIGLPNITDTFERNQRFSP